MLLDLEIRDFAIIDHLRIQLGTGLNALTGETGAGKSIIIDALGAVLGERVSADMVRSGARTAYIDARFELDGLASSPIILTLLDEHGIDASDGELILSREIQAGGRSTARINSRTVTAALLGTLGQQLVDIHGQSDHLSLLRPTAQLAILDRYAHLDDQRLTLAEKVRLWRETRTRLEAMDSNARDRVQRIDLLRYQTDEIDAAALRPGEETELDIERNRLANAERLAELVATAVTSIAGDDPDGGTATDILRTAIRSLTDAAAIDTSLQGVADRTTEITLLLDEISLELRDYLDEVAIDPARLEIVQERLESIKQLKRKYGGTITEILAYAEEARRELESLDGTEQDEDALRTRVEEMETQVRTLASKLTHEREAAAIRLADDASRAAAELNLGSMMFSIEVRPKTGSIPFDETGADYIEFMFAPNAGEIAKPLARVASGGETARMMLALKSVLADTDHTPTLVFDEVDVGIGGRSGQMVGQKLQQLAVGHQVIVITHLPQIAAVAEHHFKIRKDASSGRTISRVVLLDETERIDELAAMIDGEPPSATSRKAALEMLERAGVSI